METLINSCVDRLKEKSRIRVEESYSDMSPKTPSIIFNYNWDEGNFKIFLNFLKQLWPQIYLNIQYTNEFDGIKECEKNIRRNEVYDYFNDIEVHILCNITKAKISDVVEFVKQKLENQDFKLILHAFFDYENSEEKKANEQKLLELLKTGRKNFKYLFFYCNRLINGALWIREDLSKIFRLAANVISIMISGNSLFSNDRKYTFSYNILEKPTKKIAQLSLSRILKNLTEYYYENNDEDLALSLEKKMFPIIWNKAERNVEPYMFSEDDFKYLPNNKALKGENKSVVKSIGVFEAHYPIASSCYNALISDRIKEIEKIINIDHIDFSKEIDEVLSFFSINAYLENGYQSDDLFLPLKGLLESEKDVSAPKPYFEFLCDFANQKLVKEIINQIYEKLKLQLTEKIEKSLIIGKKLKEILNSNELLINALDKELSLKDYYTKIVDDYFSMNQKDIIAKIDKSVVGDKRNLFDNLKTVIYSMYDANPVFYMSFEDEIDERVGKNTSQKMFESINRQDNVSNNICFCSSDIYTSIKLTKTNDVVLLINPQSKLLKHNIEENYHKIELNRQDCIERLDFHVLSYEGEDDENN